MTASTPTSVFCTLLDRTSVYVRFVETYSNGDRVYRYGTPGVAPLSFEAHCVKLRAYQRRMKPVRAAERYGDSL